MKARLIVPIGTRVWLRVYWGENCPRSCGTGTRGYHNAQVFLFDTDKTFDWDAGGKPQDYPVERWPMKCDHCPAEVPQDKPWTLREQRSVDSIDHVTFQVFRKLLYGAGDWKGLPQPGDLFWAEWYPCARGGGCIYGWTNCDGRHLMAILPNGYQWDVMSRCSNCTRREDTTHRCWVLQGVPPNATVGKGGNTCSAGAGSIIGGNWHGFLHGGQFNGC